MKAELDVTTTFPDDDGGDAQRRPEVMLLRGLLMTSDDSDADVTIGRWLVIMDRVVGEIGAERLMP